ncbi:uncharacterized protein EV422DRAFT_393702 [Fimicolochytrium jonesii]|uniref:uncharacterized protein n=1 Tax=Fimicolochytrium jonesii TaxID=1396493 RepID=UPI0022FDE438|nr:uncharacterized protein EV422DRAFT_393702 [Fimicolochytrium jonesii]KAI8823145.1 hypothetical protein EV422DRAFT_393702 [Fimicolochytrium jonesii]
MSDRALNTRPADSTVFQRIAKARPASSTGRARAAAAQQGPTPTNAEGRVSTAQLLARFEQTSDDELLARIIAIEEDEKIARKIQEDLARGIEPQLRPFSGRPGGGGPSQQNSRSDSHLNKVGFTDPIDDAGIGSPLASTDAPMRESISRSGGLHNLNEGEAKPLAGRRASALRGSLAISANQSTNLASDESLNADDDHHDDDDASHPHPPATTNSSQPNTSQRADIPQPNYTSTPPQPDRLEFPTPKWDTTASESDATSEKGSEQEQGSGVDPAPAQPPAAVPRHRSARPESARRGVPRHQKVFITLRKRRRRQSRQLHWPNHPLGSLRHLLGTCDQRPG